MALVGLAFQQHSREFLFIGTGTTALFSVFNFFYGKVRLSHVERVVRIERYLESEQFILSASMVEPKTYSNYRSGAVQIGGRTAVSPLL